MRCRLLNHRHALVVALLLSAPACGKNPLENLAAAGVGGVVTDRVTKLAIAGAIVRCQGHDIATDANGAYFISPLDVGTSRVTVTHARYFDGGRDVQIKFLAREDFELEPKP
jgi:molybdopterin/thiamine biosynthesis adenylyltransferase